MKWFFFLLATLPLFAKQIDPITTVKKWCKEERGLTEGRYLSLGVLASVSSNGTPHTRIMKISHFDKKKGALFFTHKNTRKWADFQLNPHASLTLWLPKTHRQITLEGKVEEVSRIEAEKYWKRMPRFMKISFLASSHTGTLESNTLLQKRQQTLKTDLSKEVPMPRAFVGYRLIPLEITFYQENHRAAAKKEIATLEKEGWSLCLYEP